MSFLRLSLLPLLLLSIEAQAVSFDKYDFSSPWIVRNFSTTLFPTPIKTRNDSIVYFSHSWTSEPQLYFQDPNKEPCTIFAHYEYDMRQPPTVWTLGNGKILISLPTQFILKEFRDNKLVMVEPNDCSQQYMTVTNFTHKFDRLIPYQDTFDVVFEINASRKLVRYNEDMAAVKVMDNFTADYHFIEPVKDYDPSGGYYAFTFEHESNATTIKKLDTDFQEVKSIEYLHSSHYSHYEYAMSSAKNGKLTICNHAIYSHKLECASFDKDLRELFKVQMSYQRDIWATVMNLPRDGFVLVYKSAQRSGDSSEEQEFVQYLHVQHVTEDGKVEEPVEIARLNTGFYDKYAFQLGNGSVCVIVNGSAENFKIKQYRMKCIAPPAA